MSLGRWCLVLIVGGLLVLPPASAQIKSCGEGFELFIRNPDVAPSGDGKFHVSGDFFMQFQVIGERADEIETFAFSVGLPVDNPQEICQLPVWPAGLMLEAYKSDTDKSDGFFILMNTQGQSTPQGIDLSVAVHGYDSAGNELARFWGTAIVESCESTAPLGGCPEDEANRLDKTMPWPILLPGDGQQALTNGFTIEFAEELANLTVLLNNEDVTGQLVEWDGRLWDSDTFYDYGPRGLVGTVAPMCSLTATPLQNCITPGPAYEWNLRGMTDDDVIRVVATDFNGNQAIKEIHIGSSVAGGAIADGLPILQMTFEESTLEIEPGNTAVFTMTMQNTGGGEGHPFAGADVPEGWDYTWVPGHEPVPAGGSSAQEFHVIVPENTTAGDFPVTATMDYRQGTQDKTLQSKLTVRVLEPAVVEPKEDDDAAEDSPAIGLVLALAFIGAIGAALRKRT